MLPKRYRLALVLVLLPTLLACGLRKTTTPEPGVPVSQAAADRMEEKLKASVQQGQDGAFELEFTDIELTSYLVLKMAEQSDRAEDIPLEDFQVRFSDDRMHLSGALTSVCPFRLNVRVTASARVEDGQLEVRVEKARMGAVPLPKGVLGRLSRVVSETIVESPDHMERAVEVTEVEIGEGVMRLSGRVVGGG
jgi:hypothetical protein